MASRTGSADLPLHGGRVPPWLAQRMERLGRVVTEAIVHHYGRRAFLERLAHPFWFQSFGTVMGMDWHSSGITTSVVGALKRGLEPVADELGLRVCGGRGRSSRRTPDELARVGERTGLDGAALARTSRLVAKIDSAAVQDGFELYLHGFIVADDGDWVVVQQGMNGDRREARRYHWLSSEALCFVESPHAAIEGRPGGEIRNLADHRAHRARDAGLELVALGPDRALAAIREAGRAVDPQPETLPLPHLSLPAHHDVRREDVVLRRLHGALAAAAERGPSDYPELLLTPGLGARTVASLALVAEVIHGAPSRFSDPARFSFAHGGKDGHPFPVPLDVYDETLAVLRNAVTRAKLGLDDRTEALRRLDREARRLERQGGPDFDTLVDRGWDDAARYRGRSVGRQTRPRRPAPAKPKGQLGLVFDPTPKPPARSS
jgi:hypothetical protein